MRWGRVDVAPLGPGDGPGSFVIASFAGPPREVVDDTMRLVGLVSVAGLLLTAAIAYVVAGRILAPVRTVRRAAAEITERDLTRRGPMTLSDAVDQAPALVSDATERTMRLVLVGAAFAAAGV